MNGRLTITDVAEQLGVTPRTIMRWEKNGKIKKSKRDWRGWRFYLKEDLDNIKKFYESSYEYDGGQRSILDIAKTTAAGFIIAGMLSLPVLNGECSAQQNSGKAGSVGEGRSSGVTETKDSVDIDLNQLPVVVDKPNGNYDNVKYTLGPDDVIAVEVRRHQEFSAEYTINSEGTIEYKFVGDININGMTKKQVKEKLTDILSEYLIEPDIDVRIAQYRSKVFYVVGEVGNPGKFYMKGNSLTVREALVQAGLPTQSAATRKCRLITPDNAKKNQYKEINVYELLYAGDLKENFDMKPGDVLYIPSTIMAKFIRVISPATQAVAQTAGAAASGAALAL